LIQDVKAKQSSRNWVPIVLVGAVLVVAANALLAFRAVQALEISQRWVDHTWEVLSQAESLMSAAKDAETASRGFLITGEDRFLDPLRSAQRELPIDLTRFAKLTADSPQQHARAAEMQSVLQQRLALIDESDAYRSQAQHLDVAREKVLMDTGKSQMDHLRQIANAAENEELQLLARRKREAAADALSVRYTLGLASGLDLILIVCVYLYFLHERRLRLAAEYTAEDLARSRVEIERKASEIHQLNATLETRVQERTFELEAANRNLDATNRELEAFSYSVSHDLRAPLRTIDGFSLALEEDYADVVGDDGKDYIKRVRTGVQRMGGLIDALLQLSRITRAEIERESIDLTELADSVASQLVDQNPQQKIEFTIEKGLRTTADPKVLRVALENLFGNAIKFSSRKPETKVEFGWDQEKAAWFVRDNGAGFDMHYEYKLFGAFNRLHGDKDFQGSGIGLATVARVIRRHHGKIWANSVVNNGATFWFTLNEV
jgi:signal transduction histidine kinase